MIRKTQHIERLVLPTVFAIGATTAGVLATTANILIPLTVVPAVIFALLVLQRRTQVATLCTAGALCIMGASSQFLSTDPTNSPSLTSATSGPAVVARVLGVALLVTAAISAHKSLVMDPKKRGTARQWQKRFVLPLVVFIAVATLPHGLARDFVIYELAAILLITSIAATSVGIPTRALTQGLVVALSLAVFASLVAGIVSPNTAIEQGRLRGLFENANTLGYFSFLSGALAILKIHSIKLRAPSLIAVVASLSWSGSRASAIALLVLAVGYLLTKRPTQGMFTIVFLTAGAIGLAVYSHSFRSWFAVSLRTNNSRDSSLEAARNAVAENHIWGAGLHSAAFSASSPLGALAQGGIIGLALILLVWIGVLALSIQRGRKSLIFALAAFVHSVFEAWLLSPFSPLLLLFSACWWAVSFSDGDDPLVIVDGQTKHWDKPS